MKNLEEMQNEALIRIVDDDADLRKGLTFMLECAGWKSAAYPSARDFLTQDSPSIPGCLILDVQMAVPRFRQLQIQFGLILDVQMAGMTGIELQHEMNRRGNTLPIIFLTGHGDIDMAVTAMIDGAANFIQKPPESGKLLAAIETCVSQSLKNAEGTSSPAVLRQRLSLLTRRELEIAELVAAGLTSRQIAERLGISERTVEVHRSSLHQKLRMQITASSLSQILKK